MTIQLLANMALFDAPAINYFIYAVLAEGQDEKTAFKTAQDWVVEQNEAARKYYNQKRWYYNPSLDFQLLPQAANGETCFVNGSFFWVSNSGNHYHLLADGAVKMPKTSFLAEDFKKIAAMSEQEKKAFLESVINRFKKQLGRGGIQNEYRTKPYGILND